MMNIDMKYIQVVVGLLLCYCLYACSPRPESVQPADRLLVLYPEYQDVTIPYNVAPLNFLVRNEGVDAVCVSVKGASDSLEINARGNKAVFPLKAWRALLEAEKGHTLEVTVTARTDGRWLRYPSFAWQVVADKLDAYVSYRLIEPGYEVWNALQIRERCIENFEERILADNSQTDGKCMNCHVHGGNSGNLSMFHLRGEGAGTVLNRDGKLRKLALKNEQMISAAVYGDFHPDGRYGVFSSNVIIPTFSADGKWIYYCSAPTVPLPDSVQQLRYSLCRIAFDANHGAWGDRVDTLWNARLEKGSVCHPKASPDGRYLLYTVADYGTFPIWHRETELQLMDLQTGAIDSLPMVNSSRSDTYHSWSSGSRWFAFASKRGDGQYGRVYFAYLDAEGKAHKPFVLPQSDPEKDDLTLKSYNIPDLSATPVPFDASSIKRINRQLKAEEFK